MKLPAVHFDLLGETYFPSGATTVRVDLPGVSKTSVVIISAKSHAQKNDFHAQVDDGFFVIVAARPVAIHCRVDYLVSYSGKGLACDCGASQIGIPDFSVGHTAGCSVSPSNGNEMIRISMGSGSND